MTDTPRLGHCLCQAIRYRLSGEIRNRCNCHCESCRRATGAPFVAWGTVSRASFELTHGALSLVQSSRDVERGFCGKCGSSLTYQHALRTEELDITLASLADPSPFAPVAHIWVRDKLPWIRLSDGLPAYDTVVPEDT